MIGYKESCVFCASKLVHIKLKGPLAAPFARTPAVSRTIAGQVYNNHIENCGIHDFVINKGLDGKNGEGIYVGEIFLRKT